MLAVLSDVDLRVARVLSLGKDMQPNMFQDENIQFLDITLGYIFSNPADLWSISRYMWQPSSPISNGVMTFIEQLPNE